MISTVSSCITYLLSSIASFLMMEPIKTLFGLVIAMYVVVLFRKIIATKI